MKPRSRIFRCAVVTLLVWSVFAVVVFAVDARWRLYTEASDFGWIAMGIPVVAIAAYKGLRLPWSLPALILMLAFGVISGRTVKAKYLKIATASCANHSSFTGMMMSASELPSALTNSTEFADYVEQLYSGQTQRPLTYCPGAKWSNTRTGVAFVGAGMGPTSTAPSEEVLIAFCFFDSHPLPFDHMRCLTLSPNRAPHPDSLRIINRSGSDTRDMTNRLAIALKQARSGLVPYTIEAQTIMEVELQKRIEALASGRVPERRSSQ